MQQQSISPLELAAEIFQKKNYRFMTKDSDRLPTFYFETLTADGYTLLGRIRQEHPGGPKVSMSIGGSRKFINPANNRDVRTGYTEGFHVYEAFPDGATHLSGGKTVSDPIPLDSNGVQQLVKKFISEGKYSLHTA